MRFWKRKTSIVQIKKVSTEQMELETAKEILQEVFHARPSDVEYMIHSRLEERGCRQECEEGSWPATFCVGE
jgi:transcriptional regulator CtsR